MRSIWLSLALVLGAAAGGAGQAPLAGPPPSGESLLVQGASAQLPASADTLSYLARPIKPLKAFFMSLAVPGWSQARLDRKLTGALFITVEGLAVGMTVKTIRELKYLERVGADSARIVSKRSQRQDWLILLGFNHLFSGIEAFVGSQLHDFPEDLRLRAVPMPAGGIGFQASVPFRWP
ncbi:MAG: hypothetical protein KF785_03470 [Gemmatimonadales bacterium]|nr:hypothetical protein [Gemmatimonadales bacterium]